MNTQKISLRRLLELWAEAKREPGRKPLSASEALKVGMPYWEITAQLRQQMIEAEMWGDVAESSKETKQAAAGKGKRGRKPLSGNEKSLAKRIFEARKEGKSYDCIVGRWQDEIEDVVRKEHELGPKNKISFEVLRAEAKRLRDTARKWEKRPEVRGRDLEK